MERAERAFEEYIIDGATERSYLLLVDYSKIIIDLKKVELKTF